MKQPRERVVEQYFDYTLLCSTKPGVITIIIPLRSEMFWFQPAHLSCEHVKPYEHLDRLHTCKAVIVVSFIVDHMVCYEIVTHNTPWLRFVIPIWLQKTELMLFAALFYNIEEVVVSQYNSAQV